jgi:hypothetical protein
MPYNLSSIGHNEFAKLLIEHICSFARHRARISDIVSPSQTATHDRNSKAPIRQARESELIRCGRLKSNAACPAVGRILTLATLNERSGPRLAQSACIGDASRSPSCESAWRKKIARRPHSASLAILQAESPKNRPSSPIVEDQVALRECRFWRCHARLH